MNGRTRQLVDRFSVRRRVAWVLVLFLIGLFAFPNGVYARDPYGWPSFDEIQVQAYIVTDADTGEVIMGKDADLRMANASTTKLMTALVLLEDPAFDPERMLTVSEEAVQFPAAGAVHMAISPGETFRTVDCLAAMLVRSANDMANVIAENYGGAFGAIDPDNLNNPLESRRRFMERVNARAGELGALNTHFTNPAGFDETGHYTTASDLSLIMRELLKHPLFLRLSGSRLYTMPPTDVHPGAMWSTLHTTNGLIDYGATALASRYYKAYVAGKTGSTIAAGYCLAIVGTTHDDRTLVGVALNLQPIGSDTSIGRALPVRALMEEAARRAGAPEIDPLRANLDDSVPGETAGAAAPDPSAGKDIWLIASPDGKGGLFSGWSSVQIALLVIGVLIVLLLTFLAGWYFSYRHEKKVAYEALRRSRAPVRAPRRPRRY